VRRIVEAAGGTTDDIIKITVWMKDPAQRAAVNTEWVSMFPSPDSRPARHTLRGEDGDALVSCDVTAVLQ
jgi:enamine deaminase RidA (YjgF/YER057c/UK114 family)